jgi:hypothetical protein
MSAEIKSLADERERRRQRELVPYAYPETIAGLVSECTRSDNSASYVSLDAPDPGNHGWALTPDQADALALELIRAAQCARGDEP